MQVYNPGGPFLAPPQAKLQVWARHSYKCSTDGLGNPKAARQAGKEGTEIAERPPVAESAIDM